RRAADAGIGTLPVEVDADPAADRAAEGPVAGDGVVAAREIDRDAETTIQRGTHRRAEAERRRAGIALQAAAIVTTDVDEPSDAAGQPAAHRTVARVLDVVSPEFHAHAQAVEADAEGVVA